MIFLAFTSFIRKFASERNQTDDGRYNEISECGGDGWEAIHQSQLMKMPKHFIFCILNSLKMSPKLGENVRP